MNREQALEILDEERLNKTPYSARAELALLWLERIRLGITRCC